MVSDGVDGSMLKTRSAQAGLSDRISRSRQHRRTGRNSIFTIGTVSALNPSLLNLLRARGALSEIRIEHPHLPLVGVLDLVVLEHDGSVTIVDFKTGAQKKAHEEQVALYALLRWRVTGMRPDKAALQYLDSNVLVDVNESGLVAAERSIAEEIGNLGEALLERPAAAMPHEDCLWCPVRPRCNEGWDRAQRTSPGVSSSVDVEVEVSSNPRLTGFLGASPSGEVPVLFEAAVGYDLPPLRIGD